MGKAESIQRHKELIIRHKESFREKRERLTKDTVIDTYEKELASLFRKCASREITLSEYETKSAEIEDKKKARLAILGEPADAMIYRPLCTVCDDTGSVRGKICSCLNRLILEDSYEESGIYEILKKENFDNFNIDLFSDEVKDNRKRSQRSQMTAIRKRIDEYTENFDEETSSLYFVGSTGAGKTYLAHCIAKKLIDDGYYVVFVTSSSITKELVDYNFGRCGFDAVEKYYKCDLLIIDDLGTEGGNDYTRSALYEIINERMSKAKKTIITSNYTLEKLKNVYEERLISRLSSYEHIPFLAGDLRLRSKMLKKQK
ncbi:MAG: ATP-binding protein [Eubacteriaceae bacterium]|nr:ATP-binding protein [Eubacteriaceae bacterium]